MCAEVEIPPATTPASNVSILQPKLVLSARLNLAKHLPGTGEKKGLSVYICVTFKLNFLACGTSLPIGVCHMHGEGLLVSHQRVGLRAQGQARG